MKKADEKRGFLRVPVAAIVDIGPETPHKHEDCVSVETLDMSSGGISFSSDRSFEIGSRWKVTLRLDESLRLNPDWNPAADETGEFRNVSTICEIVRVKGSDEIGYDIAARFIQMRKNDIASVEKFLSEL